MARKQNGQQAAQGQGPDPDTQPQQAPLPQVPLDELPPGFEDSGDDLERDDEAALAGGSGGPPKRQEDAGDRDAERGRRSEVVALWPSDADIVDSGRLESAIREIISAPADVISEIALWLMNRGGEGVPAVGFTISEGAFTIGSVMTRGGLAPNGVILPVDIISHPRSSTAHAAIVTALVALAARYSSPGSEKSKYRPNPQREEGYRRLAITLEGHSNATRPYPGTTSFPPKQQGPAKGGNSGASEVLALITDPLVRLGDSVANASPGGVPRPFALVDDEVPAPSRTNGGQALVARKVVRAPYFGGTLRLSDRDLDRKNREPGFSIDGTTTLHYAPIAYGGTPFVMTPFGGPIVGHADSSPGEGRFASSIKDVASRAFHAARHLSFRNVGGAYQQAPGIIPIRVFAERSGSTSHLELNALRKMGEIADATRSGGKDARSRGAQFTPPLVDLRHTAVKGFRLGPPVPMKTGVHVILGTSAAKKSAWATTMIYSLAEAAKQAGKDPTLFRYFTVGDAPSPDWTQHNLGDGALDTLRAIQNALTAPRGAVVVVDSIQSLGYYGTHLGAFGHPRSMRSFLGALNGAAVRAGITLIVASNSSDQPGLEDLALQLSGSTSGVTVMYGLAPNTGDKELGDTHVALAPLAGGAEALGPASGVSYTATYMTERPTRDVPVIGCFGTTAAFGPFQAYLANQVDPIHYQLFGA